MLSRVWASHNKIRKEIFVVLSVSILGIILWLFIHADIQFERWAGINLLLFWLPFVVLSFLIGALVNLSRISVQNQIQEANATAEQSRSELHLLQSQLSPHFLFNTLNNLYGLSITQHQKLPPLLLKLSELLRYSVYDVKELFVPLKNELAYINNYIDFEKIRNGDRLKLTTSFEPINSEDIKIAPMLLTTFIENAFKHSKNTADKEIFIDMELKTWADRILFSIKNSYDKASTENSHLDRNSGVGFANAKKRLALLYPNEHELRLEEKDGIYSIMLQLKIK
jgi:LytS/YehU family sensor histidine kinase